MRPILFRGKRKDIGEWVIGMLYEYQNKTLISVNIVEYPTHSDPGGLWIYHDYEVIPETVGQYIGIDDKKNVKQFEHDILKVTWETASTGGYLQSSDAWCEHEVICVIQYVKDRFAYIGKDGKQVSFKSDAKREVIGNLHDNPELMK